jgi:hypothetical protein
MKKLSILGFGAALILMGVVGCGDDDDNPSGNGGSGAEAGDGNDGGGKGGKGGTGNTGGKGGKGGSGGSDSTPSAGTGGDEPVAGAGGGDNPPAPCDIYGDRPVEEIEVDGDDNIVTEKLTADKVWKLSGRYFVPEGHTLEIEPCTRIEGTPKPNAGSLFVMRGAKIKAVGTADAPILFTSEDHAFSETPWGGVVLLGKAPIGPAIAGVDVPERIYEGMTDERAAYGGDDANDDSGELAYVRIEFGGDIIVTEPAAKEINGLSFGGVGDATKVHHIMVKDQYDDCFEWFGGTVNADHLICQNSGDDMFDADEGFKGHLQYLFGRNLVEGTSNDPNGFEWDGNQPLLTAPAATLGTPQASNATLCGFQETTKTSYGAVLRRSLGEGTSIANSFVTGFNFGVDARDNVGTNAAPLISWTDSSFFEQITEDGSDTAAGATADDDTKDGTFDEEAWLTAAASNNTLGEVPEGFNCYADVPVPPTSVVEAPAPGEGFDAAGAFQGAFQGAFGEENWAEGQWVNWE